MIKPAPIIASRPIVVVPSLRGGGPAGRRLGAPGSFAELARAAEKLAAAAEIMAKVAATAMANGSPRLAHTTGPAGPRRPALAPGGQEGTASASEIAQRLRRVTADQSSPDEIRQRRKAAKARLLAEKNRRAEQSKKARQRKIAEQRKIAAERRIVEERKIAERRRIAEQRRVAEERRIAEERKIAEQRRIAEERKIAEDRKIAEHRKIAAQRKIIEAHKEAEEKRIHREREIARERKIARQTEIAAHRQNAGKEQAAQPMPRKPMPRKPMPRKPGENTSVVAVAPVAWDKPAGERRPARAAARPVKKTARAEDRKSTIIEEQMAPLRKFLHRFSKPSQIPAPTKPETTQQARIGRATLPIPPRTDPAAIPKRAVDPDFYPSDPGSRRQARFAPTRKPHPPARRILAGALDPARAENTDLRQYPPGRALIARH